MLHKKSSRINKRYSLMILFMFQLKIVKWILDLSWMESISPEYENALKQIALFSHLHRYDFLCQNIRIQKFKLSFKAK